MLTNPPQLIPYQPAISTGFFDDFIIGDSGTTATDNTFASFAFKRSLLGAGAQAFQISAGSFDQSKIGSMTLRTQAANERSGIYTGNAIWVLPVNGPISMEWRVRVPILSVAAQRFSFQAGIMDAQIPSQGAYFWYDDSVSLNWQIVTANVGQNRVLTTKIVPTNTFQRLKITSNPDGTIWDYYVDEQFAGEIQNTSVPTTAMTVEALQIRSVGAATPRDIDIDFVNYQQILNVQR